MSLGSLRLRLLLGAGAFIATAVAIAAVGLTALFKSHVERWIDADLNARLDRLIAGLDAGADGTVVVARLPSDPRFEAPLSGLYWQVAVKPSGPLLRSRSLWDSEIALPAETSTGGEPHHHLVPGPGRQTLYALQRRVELPARLGGRTVDAAVALDDAQVRSAVWRFATVLVPSLVLLGALLIAAAWMQIAFGLRPLAAIRARLADIGSGAARRLGTGFPDEVQPLAREVDALLDARDQQIERARARASDLAHGLKTPLQVLAGNASRLKAQGETEIAAEIELLSAAMQRHVERHLARARITGHDVKAFADVCAVAERILRVIEKTPDGSRLVWAIDIPQGLTARIDAEDLTEALGNLVENAARYARSRAVVSARAESGTVAVVVEDDGPGIPMELQEEARRRGRRLDSSGDGAGLGLAIVAEIAEAWGATLTFETLAQGFRVRLRIPAA